MPEIGVQYYIVYYNAKVKDFSLLDFLQTIQIALLLNVRYVLCLQNIDV